MCGRYTLFTTQVDLEARFDATFESGHEARYNCAPGQWLPVLTAETDRFRRMQWGLIPAWSDDGDESYVNARAETVAEKRSFREAYERRRCLVPADGFYEWTELDGDNRPYRVAFEDDRPFAMAGLWERWTPRVTQADLSEFAGDPVTTVDPVESFTVVTTTPNDLVADLHHRMAVVLHPEDEGTWLRGDADEAASLLKPYPGDELDAYPVSARVNDPSNDDPRLVEASS